MIQKGKIINSTIFPSPLRDAYPREIRRCMPCPQESKERGEEQELASRSENVH